MNELVKKKKKKQMKPSCTGEGERGGVVGGLGVAHAAVAGGREEREPPDEEQQLERGGDGGEAGRDGHRVSRPMDG
jgi:hypothetical protein